ncbi:MAG TPA: ABC transporter ATP-binding protein [Azospirillum sp.]
MLDPPEPIPASPWPFLWMFVRRRFWGRSMLLALTAVGGIGLMSFEPVALKALVDGLADAGGWSGDVLFWFLALGALWIGSALFNRAREIVDLYTGPALRQEIQFELFAHLIAHSPRYFQENLAGKLGQKVKQAGQSALQLLDILSNDIVRIVVVLSFSLYLLYSAHGVFAVLLVGWTAAQIGVSALLARRCIALSRAFSEQVAASTGHMVDVIANIELVRAFVRRQHEFGLVSETLGREAERSRELRWFLVKMWFILFNALLVFQIALIGIAVSEAVAGRMSVGDFAMVFSLASIVGLNVWNLSTRMLGFFEHLGNLSGALELIARPHEILDRPGTRPLAVASGGITVSDVRFAHADGTVVFDGLSLSIAPGERVALVGPSGAGKSTLVKLLRRQYEPQHGRILIDGQDIATVTLDSLNDAVAEVPQSPALFHRTIRENIAYARPDADEAAVLDASRKAHCHDFVVLRPNGYRAVVGEQGVRLSGGERQRVAIARALLKDAPILILDEATSALDSETERLIQDALWTLFKGRTVIAIAHRLSTITGMDRVFYIERGRILESGSHADLLARDGRYADLWRQQIGGFLPAGEDRGAGRAHARGSV